MAFDAAKTAVIIVTWNRLKNLAECAWSWATTMPTYRAMYVIANHPYSTGQKMMTYQHLSGVLPDGVWPKPEDETDDSVFSPPPRCLILSTGRPFEHVGNLAQSWNLGMLWAFRDPQVEWVLCSQDDIEALPGWQEKVASFDADLYLSPTGDNVFLFNRRVMREVGWFDERYTTIGYHEWDWEARAILALGRERVSIEDGHGWYINPLGLYKHWIRMMPDGGYKSEVCLERNKEWMLRKWRCDLHDELKNITDGAKSLLPPKPPISEIDWYPWFNRGS